MTKLSPTALAVLSASAILFAAPASAKDVKLSLGGYFRAGVAISDYAEGGDESEESVHIIRDGEIHFKGKGTLDNGLTIEARVELEAFTTGDQIDENWVAVSSSFGTVLVGSNDDAVDAVGGAGLTSIIPNFSYYDATLGFTPAGDLDGIVGGSDAIGIQYYTPTIAGFSLGVSYQPDLSSDGGSDAQATGADNDDARIAIGANYHNSFGEFAFDIGGGYITDDSDDNAYAIGAEVSFAGFTTYGRYEIVEADSGDDTTGFGVGLKFATGPWTFGGGYGQIDEDGSDELQTAIAGATYKLGDGVSLGAAAQWGDNGDDDGVAGIGTLNVNF